MNRYISDPGHPNHGKPCFVLEPGPWDMWWKVQFEDGETIYVADHALVKDDPR